MIKNGIGGANTKTGSKFEIKMDLNTWINNHKGYKTIPIKDYKIGTAFDVMLNGKHVAKILKKDSIIKFLKKEHGLKMNEIISKVLKPDSSIFVYTNNTFFVIEIKFQQVSGSVDEKLQTCDFKIKQWKKVLSRINSNVKYYYILNDWFKKKQYRDTLNYIKSIDGCDYFFEWIPLKTLGLEATEYIGK